MSWLFDEDLVDDLSVKHGNGSLKDRLTNEDLLVSQKVPLVVSYDLVDLEDTDYGFHQVMEHDDTKAYFSMMKRLSGSTIDELDSVARELHFRRTPVRGNLYKVLEKICPDAAFDNLCIFHFALYTSKQISSRETGVRSPRVYFMLGRNGIVYMLFFDPFHEINP